MRTFMILVLLSSLAAAQELPEAPSQRATPKSFWVAAGAYTASIIYDGETTVRGVESGCVENWNPTLYGERPGRARFYLVSAGLDGATMFASRRLVRSNNRFLRYTGWGLMSWGTEQHLHGAIHNTGFSCSAR
ncbi:MAG: hypothetical protein DMG89_06335 [Acidobacteria bacterium]|nr:MAG: hypothetical protein DMG89_06335 [Acidobacteriota bacterium]